MFFKIGHTLSTHKLCPAWLLIKTEQASQAEIVRRLGVSNLEKDHIFGILMKNCSKYVLASSIRQIFLKVGTPNVAGRNVLKEKHLLGEISFSLLQQLVIWQISPLVVNVTSHFLQLVTIFQKMVSS